MARGRPPSIERTEVVRFTTSEKVAARLRLHLHSEVEGRVPYGRTGEFFEAILHRIWSEAELDLAPYLGTQPGESVVRASPSTIERLRFLLESSNEPRT